MKKAITIILLAGTSLFLANCTKKMAPASSASAPKKTFTTEQLAQGKVICESNCNKCHEFHQPAEFTVQEWSKILPKMTGKAKLPTDQAELVVAWVNANAKAS